MQLATIKEQVEYVLREFPQARNSDIFLMIRLWRQFYPHWIRKGSTGEEGIWLRDLYDLPREDIISRARRLIQNDIARPPEFRYLPTTWEVARQRQVNHDAWMQAMANNSTNINI